MMKNSEWGAVAYLTHSKYGRNGVRVAINNVSVNGEKTVYAVTGYSSGSIENTMDTSRNLATLMTSGQEGSWITAKGQTASSTGNIYGIYDISGGGWDVTSSYIAIGDGYNKYLGNMKGNSTEYKVKYAYTGNGSSGDNNHILAENTSKIGDALWEFSTKGTKPVAYDGTHSYFMRNDAPILSRGGWFVNDIGIFSYTCSYANCSLGNVLRAVLINI